METNKILNADLLDIIFDGKNKNYGAYDLRKTYSGRLTKAVIFTIALVSFVFAGTVLSGMSGKNVSAVIDVADMEMGVAKENDVLPPPPPPPPPPLPKPPVELNQLTFTPPTIVKDDMAGEIIQEITDDVAISNKTVISDNTTEIIQAPVVELNSAILELPKKSEPEGVFYKVENEAQFPGGQQAWIRYLQKNLDANAPVDNGAAPGTYQVVVKFIVSKDGSISDVNAETKYGFGMEDEAVKIIQRGPKWEPALQNGRNVNAYRRQPITFIVPE